jgi:putative DNA primase/helicase
MMMDARSIAQALGGIVQNGAALVPGPGHAPHDRSLRVYLDPDAENGFRVHSFAKDDPLHCRDYVAQKLGLPKWEPRRPHTNGHSNSHAKPNGNGAHYAAPAAHPIKIEAPSQDCAACANLPSRTAPDEDGKPKFFEWGDDGPPARDEIRRHVYKRDGSPARIKVKQAGGGYVQWFRVRSDDVTGWQAKKPDGYASVPYLGAIDPFDPELAGDPIHWPEGEKDADRLGSLNLPAFTFGGTGDGLPENAATFLAGRHVVILADNDEPGRKHAEAKAALATEAGAASVRVVHFPELQAGGDVSDFIEAGGTEATLTQRIEAAALWAPAVVEPATVAETVRPAPRALAVVRASDIELKAVEWLWPGKFALGKLTLIAGEPGLGKSQLTAALAATVTTGGRWPTSDQRSPLGSVVMFSAEDDASDTIAPRLLAAGADLDRVHIVSAVQDGNGKTPGRRSFNFQTDLDLLEQAMQKFGDVRLVVIDPITSYLGKGVDSHKNADVRSVLEPVAEMAARYGAAFVGITHFSKGGEASAINRFIGSIAFIAAARAAFVVTTDPDSDIPGRRLFLPVKNNLAAKGDGLSFQIEQHMIAGNICASMVEWGGDVVTKTADEILSAGAEDSPRRTEAAEFLRVCLADGPKPSKDIEAEAKGAGISWRTVMRAKGDLGIVCNPKAVTREGGPPINKWFWSLPQSPTLPRDPQLGHVSDVADLGGGGIVGGDRDGGGEL